MKIYIPQARGIGDDEDAFENMGISLTLAGADAQVQAMVDQSKADEPDDKSCWMKKRHDFQIEVRDCADLAFLELLEWQGKKKGWMVV